MRQLRRGRTGPLDFFLGRDEDGEEGGEEEGEEEGEEGGDEGEE